MSSFGAGMVTRLLGGLAPIALAWRRYAPGAVTCLAYHHTPIEHLDLLRAHVEALSNHFDIISLADLRAGTSSVSKPRLLLTFDDAYLSQHAAARLVLNPAGIKAVFFVPTGFLDCVSDDERRRYVWSQLFGRRRGMEELPRDLQPMSWQHVRELAGQGHTIAAHTISHPSLDEQRHPATLRHEIVGAGDRLAEKLGRDVDAFAFPFGQPANISPVSLALARQRYRHVFTSVPGVISRGDRVLLRTSVSFDQPVSYLLLQAGGGMSLYYRSARRALAALEHESVAAV